MPRWLLDASLVGIGGFLGSILRFGIGTFIRRLSILTPFPWETLTVNVIGCLAIGALAGATDSGDLLRPEVRIFLFVGLLGGFTTFSTFGFETFALFRDAHRIAAMGNVALHLGLGMSAVWFGYSVTRST
jgi:CrcB protein